MGLGIKEVFELQVERQQSNLFANDTAKREAEEGEEEQEQSFRTVYREDEGKVRDGMGEEEKGEDGS